MKFIDSHESMIAWWQELLGISDYGLIWLTFLKGLATGYLLCWFFVLT